MSETIEDIILGEVGNGEEFFVVVSLINWQVESELIAFLKALILLTQNGYLRCTLGPKHIPVSCLTFDDLNKYIQVRKARGERLDDVPSDFELEYMWWTTENGLELLKNHNRQKYQ